mgnify:CR=1 FL=1
MKEESDFFEKQKTNDRSRFVIYLLFIAFLVCGEILHITEVLDRDSFFSEMLPLGIAALFFLDFVAGAVTAEYFMFGITIRFTEKPIIFICRGLFSLIVALIIFYVYLVL